MCVCCSGVVKLGCYFDLLVLCLLVCACSHTVLRLDTWQYSGPALSSVFNRVKELVLVTIILSDMARVFASLPAPHPPSARALSSSLSVWLSVFSVRLEVSERNSFSARVCTALS